MAPNVCRDVGLIQVEGHERVSMADVDGRIPARHVGGEAPRRVAVASLLGAAELTGYATSLEDRF